MGLEFSAGHMALKGVGGGRTGGIILPWRDIHLADSDMGTIH